MYSYKSYMDKSLCISRESTSNTISRSFGSILEMCRIVPSSWGGLNKFPVERASSGSQPTMLDEFEAEIR